MQRRNGSRRQFRILYRDFLFRIVDLEILSAGGEIQKLLTQFVAMLAAFSLVLAIWFVPMMSLSSLPRDRLLAAAAPLEEFLIASTMAAAGLLSLLAWNVVLPDRRDCLILGLLPLRARTILLAKAAAIASALGITIGATNFFTGLSIPLLLGGARTVLAWWIAIASSGVFAACALFAVQGILAHVLSYRVFLRVSGWTQLAAFFAILGVFFLKPAHLPPSSWFLALFRQMKAPEPESAAAAGRAVQSLLLAVATASLCLALAYQRNLRRIVEQPDIAPGDRTRPAARAGSFLAENLFSRPMERAILLFTARTIARSRQHRLLLAAYLGIGLSMALAYTRELVYGTEALGPVRQNLRWSEVNIPILVAGLIPLFFAILGVRAVFAMPIELGANWIFRVTAVHQAADYVAAARKALYLLAATPVWIAAAIGYFSMWPVTSAGEHGMVLVIVGVVMVERSCVDFHQIPFACSYLPGKAKLHVRIGAGGIAFLFLASQGVRIEFWAMQRPLRWAVFAAILGGVALYAYWRRASRPVDSLQFEDLPPAELQSLGIEPE